MNWQDFWNQDTPIYVSERHKNLHYETLAAEMAALIPSPAAIVLDHGCGEALSADRLAAQCGRLILCDGAPLVRERLSARFGANPKSRSPRRRMSPPSTTPHSISSSRIRSHNT